LKLCFLRVTILLTLDFKFDSNSNQVSIIRNLLSHVPRERYSCRQLLASPLVPASVENEYISEELLRVVRQRNPIYFSRIMEVLNNQIVDTHKDFAYDFNSNVGVFDSFMARINAVTHLNALKVFTNHGAICINSPLVHPKTETYTQIYNTKKPVELIDQNGDVVQLPYDLTVPFARKLSQNTDELDLPLKRYSLQSVYRKNLTGGQPFEIKECDFDIIFEKDDGLMGQESEIVKLVFEILENGCGRHLNTGDYTVRVNHMKNLKHLFGSSGVPLSLRKTTMDILSQLHKPAKWIQVKSQLIKHGLDADVVEKLSNYDTSEEIDSNVKYLTCAIWESKTKSSLTLCLSLIPLYLKKGLFFKLQRVNHQNWM
jgi:eukaryotic translation initiation factor 2-alpha kinase 4